MPLSADGTWSGSLRLSSTSTPPSGVGSARTSALPSCRCASRAAGQPGPVRTAYASSTPTGSCTVAVISRLTAAYSWASAALKVALGRMTSSALALSTQ